jgi:hypothetical protein
MVDVAVQYALLAKGYQQNKGAPAPKGSAPHCLLELELTEQAF